MLDTSELEADFHWEDPLEGDQWNKRDGCKTVKRGMLGEQLLVRVYESTNGGPKRYTAALINQEGPGGASRSSLVRSRVRLASVFAEVRDRLFGKLRDYHRCSDCGKLHNPADYCDSVKERLLALNICHTCNHFLGFFTKLPSPDIAVVAGEVYTLKRTSHPDVPKGFGGNVFRIRWLDGRLETCDNVWHGGVVPKNFRLRLPDNAVFLSEDAYAAAVNDGAGI